MCHRISRVYLSLSHHVGPPNHILSIWSCLWSCITSTITACVSYSVMVVFFTTLAFPFLLVLDIEVYTANYQVAGWCWGWLGSNVRVTLPYNLTCEQDQREISIWVIHWIQLSNFLIMHIHIATIVTIAKKMHMSWSTCGDLLLCLMLLASAAHWRWRCTSISAMVAMMQLHNHIQTDSMWLGRPTQWDIQG